MGYTFRNMPVIGVWKFGHGREDYGEYMCKDEVEEDNLDKRPVLFVVESFDEDSLDFIKFIETLGYFSDNEQPENDHCLSFPWNCKDEHYDVAQINYHWIMKVDIDNLP